MRIERALHHLPEEKPRGADEIVEMKGVLLSIAITFASFAVALAVFMSVKSPWVAFGLIAAIFLSSAIAGRAVWNRFTDPETRRRDLEDRVRNWFS